MLNCWSITEPVGFKVFFKVEDIPLCLKYNNKKYVKYVYSVEHINVFIVLMATSFGRYDHHQANAIQKLKGLVTCSAQNVKLCGIPFTSVSIFVNSLKLLCDIQGGTGGMCQTSGGCSLC